MSQSCHPEGATNPTPVGAPASPEPAVQPWRRAAPPSQTAQILCTQSGSEASLLYQFNYFSNKFPTKRAEDTSMRLCLELTRLLCSVTAPFASTAAVTANSGLEAGRRGEFIPQPPPAPRGRPAWQPKAGKGCPKAGLCCKWARGTSTRHRCINTKQPTRVQETSSPARTTPR